MSTTPTTSSEPTSSLPAEGPRPRLCHLRKWPDFQGYGFNLHAERSKLSQHIGKVDVRSPAESAGLLEGDRIIEVNRTHIGNENHQQVVRRIRAGLDRDGQMHHDEVLLLVIDRAGEEFYKQLGITVTSDMPNVVRLTTGSPPPPLLTSAALEPEKNETIFNLGSRAFDPSKRMAQTMSTNMLYLSLCFNIKRYFIFHVIIKIQYTFISNKKGLKIGTFISNIKTVNYRDKCTIPNWYFYLDSQNSLYKLIIVDKK